VKPGSLVMNVIGGNSAPPSVPPLLDELLDCPVLPPLLEELLECPAALSQAARSATRKHALTMKTTRLMLFMSPLPWLGVGVGAETSGDAG
jgi:hypothetical protein